jgi:hypothetical protein
MKTKGMVDGESLFGLVIPSLAIMMEMGMGISRCNDFDYDLTKAIDLYRRRTFCPRKRYEREWHCLSTYNMNECAVKQSSGWWCMICICV